jgi:hypothetical protein
VQFVKKKKQQTNNKIKLKNTITEKSENTDFVHGERCILKDIS